MLVTSERERERFYNAIDLVREAILDSHTHLLVIEARGQGEHTRARIQREHVVGPVGNQGVAQLAVGSVCVGVVGHHLADSAAPGFVLQDVERVGRGLEVRRVVVCVRNLKSEMARSLNSCVRFSGGSLKIRDRGTLNRL